MTRDTAHDKPYRFLHSALLIFAAALLATACSTPTSRTDFTERASQEQQRVTAWTAGDAAERPAYLDRLIESPTLDTLLAEALRSNPTLHQTLLTLQIRQAERRRAEGSRRPGLEAGLGAQRTEQAADSYTGTVTVSWEVDLWGRLADGIAAAERDAAAQAELHRAARDTLAAEVMTTWLGVIAQQRAVAIQQRRLDTLDRNERFILQRYRNGLGTLEDLDGARTSSATARATLAADVETLERWQRALRGLLGRTDTRSVSGVGDYPPVTAPLAELPTQTLQRRPDLRAAYHAIEAAERRATVAYKALLPSLSLSAMLQDIASSPASALLTDPAWSLLAQLTAPLYQGGQLRAAAEIADLNTALTYQQYRETLLTAVNEVGDALGNERSLAQQLAHNEQALQSARNNLAQYQRRYRAGLVDFLDLLSVQQQTYDIEARVNELARQRLSNRVTLGLALGLGVSPAIIGATEG